MPKSDAPRLCRVPGRDTWHIYHRRRRISTGETSRAAAELALRDYIEGLARSPGPIVSVTAILEYYLADRRDRNIPGLERLGYAHKPLTRILGARPPETIDDATCRAYAARRVREGVRPVTARTELQALRAALRWAAERKLIAEAPAVELPPKPEGRIRWLTEAEAARLMDGCAAPHVRLFIVIALHTCARAAAILDLTWDRVDFAGRSVDFRVPGEAQTRKRRPHVPINDTLYAALTEAHRHATTEHVIEWSGGRIERIKHGIRNAAARAKLTGISPHVLKHTAITWLLQRGATPWDVAGYADTTAETIERTYGHHSTEGMRKVARLLG